MEKLEQLRDIFRNNLRQGYGNVITNDDFEWLIQQAEQARRYEIIIHSIANIDTIFLNPDGTDREWNDKEVLKEIEELVMPVWNESCEQSRKEMEKNFKDLGIS